MTDRRKYTVVFAVLLVAALGASAALVPMVDRERGDATLQEVVYIPSGTTLKRMSLGYSGLLADIYWTRAVQYFGGKHHEKAMQYKSLKPLLEISTTLDPQLLPAYEFGSMFLSQAPPEGAGDPEAAAALVQKGIKANPTAWRLWYHLGFIYYEELHDSKRASEAFLEGSKVPGAHPWMSVMAAALAQHAGEAETAWMLWSNIHNSTTDPMIRQNAANRLRALQVDKEVETLQQAVDGISQRTGQAPASFGELVERGFFSRVPADPLGHPYRIRDGRVEVSNADDLPFITKGLPPGREASVLPKKVSK